MRIKLDIDVLNRDNCSCHEKRCRCLEIYSFSRLDVVHDISHTAIIDYNVKTFKQMFFQPFLRTCVRLYRNVKVQELRLNDSVNHCAYKTDIVSLGGF